MADKLHLVWGIFCFSDDPDYALIHIHSDRIPRSTYWSVTCIISFVLCGINFPSRSPRWSINSGYPRIVLALVLEFDSHRGEILALFAKMLEKGSTAEDA